MILPFIILLSNVGFLMDYQRRNGRAFCTEGQRSVCLCTFSKSDVRFGMTPSGGYIKIAKEANPYLPQSDGLFRGKATQVGATAAKQSRPVLRSREAPE
jgi:hypothetical protein